jgi:hypothetical protein
VAIHQQFEEAGRLLLAEAVDLDFYFPILFHRYLLFSHEQAQEPQHPAQDHGEAGPANRVADCVHVALVPVQINALVPTDDVPQLPRICQSLFDVVVLEVVTVNTAGAI